MSLFDDVNHGWMGGRVDHAGAHTIGQVHCTNFEDRYNPAANSPFPNAEFGAELQAFCTGNGAATDFATLNLVTFLDFQTPSMFDTSYFVNLVQGEGVMTSDQDLYNDPRTQQMVMTFATNRTAFNDAFVASLLKMGRQGTLTGTNGIIRKQCWVCFPSFLFIAFLEIHAYGLGNAKPALDIMSMVILFNLLQSRVTKGRFHNFKATLGY